MFYECFLCNKDVDNKDGEHYEVHFVIGHKIKDITLEVTICKSCFDKKAGKIKEKIINKYNKL